MNPVKIALALVLVLSNSTAWSKNPPPGTGAGDVKANILFMLDTSGSMSSRTTTHPGDPQYPSEVAVDSQGNMWVSSRYYRDIKKYDSSGIYISKFNNKVSGWNYDRHMAVDSNDNLYITNDHQVLKYDSNGTYLKTFTGLSSPHGLAVDPAGNVYAGNNTTIMKWNSSGAVVKQWSSQASNDGLAYYNGSLYGVKNEYCYTTCKFYKYSSSTGALEQTFSAQNYSYRSLDIVVNANGIYISSYNRIKKYSLAGVYQAQSIQIYSIYGIGAYGSGDIFAANHSAFAVDKIDAHSLAVTRNAVKPVSNTRLEEAITVIQSIVSKSDLTSGANFGLMDWDHSAVMKVNIGSGSSAKVYTEVAKLSPSGGTSLDAGMNLASSYWRGSNTPIDSKAACQKNFNIVISDGSWTDRTATATTTKLYNDLGIKTFTIGFHTGGNSNYTKISKAGQTWPDSPLYSNNLNTLLTTLATYIRDAIASRQTFAAPFVVPGISSSDSIYQSLFTYKKTHQWEGHLEKYKLNADGSVGDLQWDAGKKLNTRASSDRNIWTIATDEGITTSLNNFTTTNKVGLQNLLWENSGKTPTPIENLNLINFVRGIDSYDEDGDSDYTDSRWKLADIFHSGVNLVGKPSEVTNKTELNSEGYYRYTKDYNKFQASALCGTTCSSRKEVIYVGANDGMLHAFEASSGKELWAFIPPMVLPKLRNMISAKANSSTPIFGVDGSPIVRDLYYGGTWRTVLMTGLGRGGHGYFALDVTNPSAPSFLFGFSNDPVNKTVFHWNSTGQRTEHFYTGALPPAAVDFSKLGEAWSTPRITLMPHSSGQKWVAVFGAGFNSGVNPNYGSAVYVLDLENDGQILKRIDITDAAGGVVNSVPSVLGLITPDTTSLADYKGALVYFSDLESKLWKINLTDTGTLYEKTQLFNGGGNAVNGRMNFHQLSASLDTADQLWLFHGTGDQENLQEMSAALDNHIYGIKDKQFPSFASVTSADVADLRDISPTGSICPTTSDPGWVRKLKANEKVTGKIAIWNETLFVSRYIPNTVSLCTPGKATLSENGITCGNTVGESNLGEGIATGAVVHKGKIYVGISGEATNSKLASGYVRKGNIIVGTPTSSPSSPGKVKVESWRELW